MRAFAAGFTNLGLAACQPAGSDGVVIRGARAIDGAGATARAVSVRIHDGRTDAAGTDIAISSGARAIAARGQILIPGLFDLPTHLSTSAVPGASADWQAPQSLAMRALSDKLSGPPESVIWLELDKVRSYDERQAP